MFRSFKNIFPIEIFSVYKNETKSKQNNMGTIRKQIECKHKVGKPYCIT